MAEEKIPEHKNLLKFIAERIGGGLDEEFAVEGLRGTFKITKKDFLELNPNDSNNEFYPMPYDRVMQLLRGELNVIKKEFIPKTGEDFWSYNNNWAIIHYKLNAVNLNFLTRLKSGLVCKTRTEAYEKREDLYYELTGSKMEKDKNGNVISSNQKYLNETIQEKEIRKEKEQQILTNQIEEGKEFYLENRPGIYKLIDRVLYVCEPGSDNPEEKFIRTDEPIPAAILTGKIKKKRLRFIPKPGEKFYSYNDKWEVVLYQVKKPDINFFCRLKTGIIFETFLEAISFKKIYYTRLTGQQGKFDEKGNIIE